MPSRTTRTIRLREGYYEMNEIRINKTVNLSGFRNENVVIDGTRSIDNLKDNGNEGNWQLMSRQVVNDSNEIETISVYRIKLKSNVKVWQLFHNRAEIMNARWPSAQWIYDGVFNKDRWGNGYTNYSDVEGTINDYVNGEIVDIPGNNNLYEFVQKQRL